MEWALLGGLGEEERRDFLAAARRRRFARGEVVFHAGDRGDSLHLVAKGRVAVWAGSPSGDLTLLAVFGAGDHFGELALVGTGDRRSATVTALDSVETLSVSRDVFDEVRGRHPAVDRVLVAALAAEVRRMSDYVMEVLYVPAQQRVLRRLLAVADLWGGPRPGAVVPVTQDDMAGLAGTTRPTANRILRQAEAAGLVALRRGRIELLDPAGLACMAGSA